MLTLKEFRIILLLVYAIPAAITAFVRPGLEKYFISNADVTLISSCNSMGELLVVAVSAIFCSKAGKWLDRLFYFFLFASCLILISVAAVGPENITYRFYATTLNDYLVLAITGRIMNMLYMQLMSGTVLFRFTNAIIVMLGGSRFVGYTLVTFVPNFSIDTSLWVLAIVEIVCAIIDVYLFQQGHKMIAAGIHEGDNNEEE